MKKVYSSILKNLESQKDAVLVTVIEEKGSSPRSAGAIMLVDSAGKSIGTIGGGAVEYEAVKLAKQACEEKRSFIQEFILSPNKVADLGMICGGNIRVFFQFLDSSKESHKSYAQRLLKAADADVNMWQITQIRPDGSWSTGVVTEDKDGEKTLDGYGRFFVINYKQLLHSKCVLYTEGDNLYFSNPVSMAGFVYVFGGGHVSQALVPVMKTVNFHGIVIDSMREFADKNLFPQAYDVRQLEFDTAFSALHVRECDMVVIMTRGHLKDYEVLVQALRTPAYYIGLVGSKKKIDTTHAKLKADGFTEQDISRIYTPIGMPIRSETPAEIAISITGELIKVRAERNDEQ